VILFSDTTDAAEQVKGIDYGDSFSGWPSSRANSFDIAKELKASGTTLSVIGVGEGRDGAFNYATYTDDEDDTDFLRELAAVGGGRYYRTTDAKQLRGLFVQDARRLLDNHAREEDFHLKVTAHLAALDGVDMETAPPLHGFQELKPRPAAQVVLVDDREGNPILTRWPYGLGEVAVWASDAGPRWAKRLAYSTAAAGAPISSGGDPCSNTWSRVATFSSILASSSFSTMSSPRSSGMSEVTSCQMSWVTSRTWPPTAAATSDSSRLTASTPVLMRSSYGACHALASRTAPPDGGQAMLPTSVSGYLERASGGRLYA